MGKTMRFGKGFVKGAPSLDAGASDGSCRFARSSRTIVTLVRPCVLRGGILAKIGRIAVAGLAALTALYACLYAKGLHAAHPISTTAKSAGGARAHRLIVFVKGGSADVRTYRPLLDRLRAEPELAG